MEWIEDALLTLAAAVAAAPAAQDPSADLAVEVHSAAVAHVEAVRSLTVEALTAVVHSLTVEARMVAVALTDMEAWVAVAKFRAPAHAPQHSSYVAPRS